MKLVFATLICSMWFSLAFAQAPAEEKKETPEKKLAGKEEVDVGAPVQFLATLSNNATYEFLSEPVAPVIRDMIESENEGQVTLTGELPRPLKTESKILVGNDYGMVHVQTHDVLRNSWGGREFLMKV